MLKDLHEELDAAVFLAYGLTHPLSNDALLSHLVTLNAQRAAEEKTGHIRWLRPSFQDPSQAKSLSNNELLAPVAKGLQGDFGLNQEKISVSTPSVGALPWPSALPEQVRALAQVLSSHSGVLTLPEIEARFKSRGAWKKSLPRILDTLEALGRAQRVSDGWRG